jgi:isoleucyl-tRNA synthetase
LYRRDRPDPKRQLVLRAHKKLPRRLVLLSEEDRAALGVSPIDTGLGTMPAEVPRSAVNQRITLEDETRPAPGADAFRWFFYAASPPWSNTRHSLSNVRTPQRDFQAAQRLFVLDDHANIDGWSPSILRTPVGRRRAQPAHR